MRIEVARAGELGAAEVGRWLDLQRGDPRFANPFLSPRFAAAVDRARGGCEVAVLSDGAGADGFLAFERRRLGVGTAAGIGVSDCQALVHAPGLVWEPRELLRASRLAVWEFDHLLASQEPFAPYHAVTERSPVIDLSKGFESYVQERRSTSRRLLKSTQYKARKLAREVGDVRFELDARDPAALDALMTWKSRQYRRTGRADRFARDWIVRLVRDLYETRGDDFAGVLSVLYAAERPVAAHFGIRSGSVLSWWFPAYDVERSRYSPGLVLLSALAEAAAGAGIEQIDLGKGHETYKESFKSWDLPIAEGWVSRPSTAALLHRARRVPPRLARDFVVGHPALRSGARAARDRLGRARALLGA